VTNFCEQSLLAWQFFLDGHCRRSHAVCATNRIVLHQITLGCK
jgi:hypothetical protein